MQQYQAGTSTAQKFRNSLILFAEAIALFAFVTILLPITAQAQSGGTGKEVVVVNTPSVNVANPVALSPGTTVGVNSSAANPLIVRPSLSTALVFQAANVSFSSLESLGDIDVSKYEKIRIVVQNRSFAVSLVVNVVEAGQVVGALEVIDVPGCDGSGGCVGVRSATRLFEVPGRAIRFSTNADPRAAGDVVIFGR